MALYEFAMFCMVIRDIRYLESLRVVLSRRQTAVILLILLLLEYLTAQLISVCGIKLYSLDQQQSTRHLADSERLSYPMVSRVPSARPGG